MEPKPRSRKIRLGQLMRSAEDWEEAALDAIASGGVRALAIPSLAKILGVTKGSFYWHFAGLDALIAAALRRWEEADRKVIEELERIADPAERLRAAFAEAAGANRAQALYVTLTTSTDATVLNALRRVSRRRLRFLARAFEALGRDAAEARAHALLAYASYLGMIQLGRQSADGLRTARDLESYVAHASRTFLPLCLAVVLWLGGCASPKPAAPAPPSAPADSMVDRAGDSVTTAISVPADAPDGGIAFENEWIFARYGRFRRNAGGTGTMEGRRYDVVKIELPDGAKKTVYFDITENWDRWHPE